MKWILFLALLSSPLQAATAEDCLARVLANEARGESFQGQLLVAEAVMNRVASDQFPNTVCKVVFQKSQFSSRKPKHNYDSELITASLILQGEIRLPSTGALYFHSGKKPKYLEGKRLVRTEGRHRFYR